MKKRAKAKPDYWTATDIAMVSHFLTIGYANAIISWEDTERIEHLMKKCIKRRGWRCYNSMR